jgi:hypothetical protein
LCIWRKQVDKESDVASGAGEGIYWKYESALKKWDAELYSVGQQENYSQLDSAL